MYTLIRLLRRHRLPARPLPVPPTAWLAFDAVLQPLWRALTLPNDAAPASDV